MSYADYKAVIEDNIDDLITSIDLIVSTAAKIGLSANPKKCFSLHIRPDHQSCLSSQFHINGEPVAVLMNYDITSYLGKPFGFRILPESANIEDFINTGKEILNSNLAPWQKIDALKTFLYPSFHYTMRTNQCQKTDLSRLDLALKPLIKKTLGLPVCAQQTTAISQESTNPLSSLHLLTPGSVIVLGLTSHKLSKRGQDAKSPSVSSRTTCQTVTLMVGAATPPVSGHSPGTRLVL